MTAFFWVFIGEGNVAHVSFDIVSIVRDRFICLHDTSGIFFLE